VLDPEASDADFASARALQDALRERAGLALAVETHARAADLGPRIELRREADAGEAYRIAVAPDRIELSGAGPAGLRYAVETLAQLADARGRVPACDVEDAPDFARRGILLDVSRGKVPTLETLKQIVELCVRLKLNVLMLYVEHVFRFRRHPQIGAGASPLEAQTLRELDAFAAAHHVELVPALQSLGHMDHVLNLPAYAHLAETPRNWTLAPTDPGTYELLSDLYDEFLPNFRSRLFNANCDESFDLGSGRSAARGRELGPGGLLLEHVRRVRALARAHGKRTLIWADMVHRHPERIAELERDLVLLDWWYEAAGDFERVARFAEAGLEFWVCPGTASWNCLFPRVETSLENIRRWAEAGRRHGAAGLLVTDWGDYGHYNLQGGSWLAYAWAAEQAWNGAAGAPGFERAFARLRFGDDSGATARLYRELGALHDAGFAVANGSPLQYLFFDDLDEAFFVQGVQPARLRRTLRRLERARRNVARHAGRFRHEGLSARELAWAAEASLLAARKGLLGSEFLAWRLRPERLGAGARRRLARSLAQLAGEQQALARALERLWLARSRPSNFAQSERRMARSAASLRRAARALAANRPPAPPGVHPGFAPGEVMRAVLRSFSEQARRKRPSAAARGEPKASEAQRARTRRAMPAR
jgi:hypothetical protein